MEWWLTLLLFFCGLMILMLAGLPVAFAFILMDLIGVVIFWGTDLGFSQFVISMFQSIIRFSLIPIPLFILMGELLFQSKLAMVMLEALDTWLGRLPGRLSLLTIGAGTIMGALSGQSAATTAILGEMLVPEMEKRGYSKEMSLGPVLGSGGLATLIPPSTLAVFLAGLTGCSIGGLLLAGIGPGLTLAVLYTLYSVARCAFQPNLAPAYEVPPQPLARKLKLTVKNILPVSIIILAVTGIIFLGVATPTEAAATGCLATFILLAAYRRLNWGMIKRSCFSTVIVTGMLLFIMTGSVAFSQILAQSEASKEMAQFAVSFNLPPVGIMIIMQITLVLLGTFMGAVSMVMITMPIFVPIVSSLGIDILWFSILTLVNMEISSLSPPYGMGLFAMKGVVAQDTTMGDVYRAAMPFLYLQITLEVLLFIFPVIALWIPSMMGT